MNLWSSTEMDGQTPEQMARNAIRHVLQQANDDPMLGFFLGLGSGSFHKLTEAYAALTNDSVEKVRRGFVCQNPADIYRWKSALEQIVQEYECDDHDHGAFQCIRCIAEKALKGGEVAT